MGLSPLELLPDELISHIVAFLDIPSLISLHRVSSRLRSVSRFDGLLWRAHCFPKNSVSRSLVHISYQPILGPENQSIPPLLLESTPRLYRHQWPYTLEEEDEFVDWYKEFQYRNSALSDHSFIKFQTQDNSEIVDVTIGGGSGAGLSHLLAASALGDGSVCIFSLADSAAGAILGRSKPDLLARKCPDPKPGIDSSYNGSNYERGLFVNAATAHGNRAWFGAGSVLTEVDLITMQRVRTHRFPFSVTCLSSATPVLAVGTTLTLHLLDSRTSSNYIATASAPNASNAHDGERIDTTSDSKFSISTRLTQLNNLSSAFVTSALDYDEQNSRDYLLHAPPTAFLQPSPLSILHSPIDQAGGNELYVAGRFPSIMAYDRRKWPRLAGTLHSGARLSSLSIITADPSLPAFTKYALVACGEYSGRGSLEIYPLPSIEESYCGIQTRNDSEAHIEIGNKLPSVQQMYARSTSAAIRNRQSASRSKIFSVASQGIKIVTGDSEGRIRFMERDGVKHIRDWVGSWNDAYTGSGCVKKILPILPHRPDFKPSVDNGDLLLHIGEEAGILTFNAASDTTAPARGGEVHLRSDSPRVRTDEELYLQAMQSSLGNHGSDLRFLPTLDQ